MRVRIAHLLGAWSLLLGSGLGCDVQPTEARTVELDQVEQALSTELCDRVFSCNCIQGTRYPDLATCQASAAELAMELAALPEQYPAADLTYDPGCMGGLVDLLVELDCDPEAPDFDEQECVQPCHYFYGERQVGQTCQISGNGVTDCAQGLRCSGSECINPCAEDPMPLGAQQGEDCLPGDCVENLYCDLGSETCRLLPQVGESCLEGQQRCGTDLVCAAETNTCLALPQADEPCLDGFRCAEELFCEQVDFSDPMSELHCFAPRSLAEPCRGHAQCANNYCPAGFCELRPQQGEACPAGVCDDGLDCVDAVCAPASAAICWASIPGV